MSVLRGLKFHMTGHSETLIIRADASRDIGTGHVMRCLSLAQAWRKLGGEAHFVCASIPEQLLKRLKSDWFSVSQIPQESSSQEDVEFTANLARSLNASWVVVDGYHFTDEFRDSLASHGLSICAVDDFGDVQQAGLIVNQNLFAAPTMYDLQANKSCVHLLGSRYTLLREEFTDASHRARQVSCRNILVTCGGTDPTNATEKILRGLAETQDRSLQVVAVVGAGNPNLETLRELAEQLPISIQLEVNTPRMMQLMQQADLAIAAAGTTCWELAYMGVPVLALVTAENQVQVAESIEMHGIGSNLGWIHELTETEIRTTVEHYRERPFLLHLMSRAGRDCVDGQGAERVAKLLLGPALTLRSATMDDCRMLWEWRNDPLVRSVSFSSDEIPFESHSQWFSKRLEAENCLIQIAESVNGEAIGQVRFDLNNDGSTEISISVTGEHRSAGYGSKLIRTATEWMLGSHRAKQVVAAIKEDNVASQRAFEKAGYQRIADNDGHRQYVAAYSPNEVASHTPFRKAS